MAEREGAERTLVPKGEAGCTVSCSDEMSADEKSGAGAEPVITVKIPALDKYNLRMKSIQSRLQLEQKKKTPVKKEPKAKQRPVPLSKYRRRTANARERTRMQVTHHNSCSYVIPRIPVPSMGDQPREIAWCQLISLLSEVASIILRLRARCSQ